MVAEVSAAVLSILGTPVGEQQPLMEAGLDSLGAVELRNALGTAFSLELPATVTFDYPSVSALADYIASAQQQNSGALVASAASVYDSDSIAADSALGAWGGATDVVGLSGRYPGSTAATWPGFGRLSGRRRTCRRSCRCSGGTSSSTTRRRRAAT